MGVHMWVAAIFAEVRGDSCNNPLTHDYSVSLVLWSDPTLSPSIDRVKWVTGESEVVRRLQSDREQAESSQSDGRRPSPTPPANRAPDTTQCKLP